MFSIWSSFCYFIPTIFVFVFFANVANDIRREFLVGAFLFMTQCFFLDSLLIAVIAGVASGVILKLRPDLVDAVCEEYTGSKETEETTSGETTASSIVPSCSSSMSPCNVTCLPEREAMLEANTPSEDTEEYRTNELPSEAEAGVVRPRQATKLMRSFVCEI